MNKFIFMRAFVVFLLSLLSIIGLVQCEKDEKNNSSLVTISPDTIVFNNSETKKLYLRSSQPFEYKIVSCPNWIVADPIWGTSTSSITDISLTSYFGYASQGIREGYLVINTSFGLDSVYLKGIIGKNSLYLLDREITINYYKDQGVFTLSNIGNVPIQYSFHVEDSNIINLSATSGLLIPGQIKDVTVYINRNVLKNGTYEAHVIANINDISDTLTIKIVQFKESKIRIYCSNIVDAEYNKQKDILVLATDNPARLYVYHTKVARMDSVSLTYVPTCVSIAPDGRTLVVGHDAHISYFNMDDLNLLKVFEVPFNVANIILANNKWAYFSSSQSLYNANYTIVDSLLNVMLCDIGFDSNAKLHPSGDYILSSRESGGFVIWDIREGQAKESAIYIFDESYGRVWFVANGNQMVSSNKKTYNVSDVFSKGILEEGRLPVEDESYAMIRELDYSATDNKMYVILGKYDNGLMCVWQKYEGCIAYYPAIFVYDVNSFTLLEKLDLEQYIVKESGKYQTYNVMPYFVFCNSNGKEIYVISKAAISNKNIWGVETIDLP
ncbi:MAG: WD40 repeat domain-containing protein [Bacteroidales bacterium]